MLFFFQCVSRGWQLSLSHCEDTARDYSMAIFVWLVNLSQGLATKLVLFVTCVN